MKKIITKVGTIIISTSLLSACNIPSKNDVVIYPENITTENEEIIEDKEYDLEDKVLLVTFDDFRKVEGSIYTLEDLKHINSLIIRIDDDFDYSFINELSNLEFLHLDDYSSGNSLKVIDGNKFENKMSITITMNPYVGEFNNERYPFLKDIKYINNLILGSDEHPLVIDEEYLEDLENVHCLYVSVNENTNIDYSDLEHLDFLYVDGDTEYVNSEDIKELKDEGVKVKVIKK